MLRIMLYFSLSIFIANAQSLSMGKIKKLSAQGEKIVDILCDKSKLPKPIGSVDTLAQRVETSGACGKLSHQRSKAVATYLLNGNLSKMGSHIEIPKGAKCPVCGMIISKYPKWAALEIVDGKKYYFDGVKDLMKFYFFDADFPYDRSKIDTIKVTDFYTLEPIVATKAFFVLGSNVYGPMGRELIAFKSEQEAKNFLKDHHGKRIVRFKEITPKMVMALDGVELE